MPVVKKYLIPFLFLLFVGLVASVNILKPLDFNSRLAHEHILHSSNYQPVVVSNEVVQYAIADDHDYITHWSGWVEIETLPLIGFLLMLALLLSVYFFLRNKPIVVQIAVVLLGLGLLSGSVFNGIVIFEVLIIALLLLYAFKAELNWKTLLVPLAIAIFWSMFSVWSILVPIVLFFAFKQRSFPIDTRVKLCLLSAVLLIGLIVFLRLDVVLVPSLSVGLIFANIASYQFEGLLLLVCVFISLILLFSKSISSSIKVLGFTLVITGFLFQDYVGLSVLGLAVFAFEINEIKVRVLSINSFVINFVMYLSIVVVFNTVVKNYEKTGVAVNTELTASTNKVKRIASKFKYPMNLFCLEQDLIEALYCFPKAKIFPSKIYEADNENYNWSELRNELNLDLIFYNLRDKTNEELTFLGERLDTQLWSLIMHKEDELAVLLRKKNEHMPIIRKLEITPNL